MSHRVLSRSLLSLLLIWQLLASAVAHPLQLPAAFTHGVTADCPEHQSAAMQAHELAGQSAATSMAAHFELFKHPCKSVCKCPCAGTPALMESLPTVAAAAPEFFLIITKPVEHLSAVTARFLRPPIA